MHEHTAPPQPVFENVSAFAHTDRFGAAAEPPSRSGAMRRRILVFFSVFLLCLLIGQSYNFARSAIYRAQAKVQITPAGSAPVTGEANAAALPLPGREAFLLEAEVLGSRVLLERAVPVLKTQGFLAGLEADAAAFALQDMLSVTPQEGTQVVHLQALGTDKALVARLVNTVIEVYREAQATSGDAASASQLAAASDELQVISAKVAEKRRALTALQQRSNIVTTVRDENQAVSRLKGLTTSLAAATDREATAAGRVRAIEQAIAQGKPVPMGKDSLTVSGIELRLSQQREEWRALERQFTPQYLEMDPNARALKVRIANLEQQLQAERTQAQQTALLTARDELASSTATVQRLQQQIAGDRQEVSTFNSQLNAVQGLQDELAGLEKMQQTAQKKLLALEASPLARKPSLLVLEPAVTPIAPWRPDYWRDAGIGLAIALAMGFLAVWFVEFFNRAERQPAGGPSLVLAHPWTVLPQPAGPRGVTTAAPRLADEPGLPLLSSPLPRELAPDEVTQLLTAASPENLPIMSCLLCGLTPGEVAALQLRHADLASDELHVPGESSRTLPLVASVRQASEQRTAAGAGAEDWLFIAAGAHALSADDIAAIVTATAHDAHLDQAQSVTPASLRHTFVAFVVRQGLRFSELHKLVGRLGADQLHALSALAPDSPRIPVDAVQRVLPSLGKQHAPPPA